MLPENDYEESNLYANMEVIRKCFSSPNCV